MINSQPTGTPWWAVPLATLVAAIVAGGFLTWNEHLKRKREDRRQWDKEIRDIAAGIRQECEKLRSALWKAHRTLRAPDEWVVQHDAEFGVPDGHKGVEWHKRAFLMDVFYPRAKAHHESIEELYDSLALIAQPRTLVAADKMLETAHLPVNNLSDGITVKSHIRAVSQAQNDFIVAVKQDIRIDDIPLLHTKLLRSHAYPLVEGGRLRRVWRRVTRR